MYKPEREKDFLFSEPVLQEQFVFFSLTSRKLNAERLAQIAGLRLGATLPTATGPS